MGNGKIRLEIWILVGVIVLLVAVAALSGKFIQRDNDNTDDSEYPDGNESNRNYCSTESRNAEACIQIYKPVCGWNDPGRIQCIRYPCAQTYSNSCQACMNENVLFWTEGECPA